MTLQNISENNQHCGVQDKLIQLALQHDFQFCAFCEVNFVIKFNINLFTVNVTQHKCKFYEALKF